jgi:hypothetical protein
MAAGSSGTCGINTDAVAVPPLSIINPNAVNTIVGNSFIDASSYITVMIFTRCIMGHAA